MRYSFDQIIQRFSQYRVVPVIAVDQAEHIIPLCQTLTESGLPVAEITFRSNVAAEAIRLLRQSQPDILIAAGTVLTCEQVINAKEAGVDVIISPGFNAKIVDFCQQLNIPIIPGVNNPSNIELALERDINTVKFFPAEASGGVKMIKALLGPYSQLQIMPTGGIILENIQHYLAIPNVIACGGSWFVEKSLIQTQNWQKIAELTEQIVKTVEH